MTGVKAELLNSNSSATLINPLASFEKGIVRLTNLVVEASPGKNEPIKLSLTNDGVAPAFVDVELAAQCPQGEIAIETERKNTVCQPCPKSEFEKSGSCKPCPTHKKAVCDAGSTVSSWKLTAGHWRADDESEDIRRCRFGVTSCPGDGQNQAFSLSRRRATSSMLNPYCSEHHVGPLCSACAAGFFLSWAGDGKCNQCAKGKSHAPTFGLLGIVFVFVLSCLVCIYKKANNAKTTRTAKKASSANSLVSKAGALYSLAEFKVFTLSLTAQVHGGVSVASVIVHVKCDNLDPAIPATGCV